MNKNLITTNSSFGDFSSSGDINLLFRFFI